MRRRRVLMLGSAAVIAIAAILLTARPAISQRRVFQEPNATSDGRFTFVLPDAQIVNGMTHPDSRFAKVEYYGIHENDDPTRRLMVVINHSNDIGDYMEWSGEGWYVNMSNDAFKFATNCLVYGRPTNDRPSPVEILLARAAIVGNCSVSL